MADSETLQVIFQTTADSAGAKQIVSDLNQVKSAAKDAGAAAQQAGQDMEAGNNRGITSGRELLKGVKAAHFAAKDFSTLMSGDFSNASGIAATALKGFNAAASAGPLGIFVGILTIAVPLLLSLAGGGKDAGDGVEKAGKASGTAGPQIEGVGAAGEKAGKGLGSAKEAADELVKTLDQIEAKAKSARTAIEELASAKAKADESDVTADEEVGNISPGESMRRKATIRHDTEQAKINADKQGAEADLFNANKDKDLLQGTQQDAKDQLQADQRNAVNKRRVAHDFETSGLIPDDQKKQAATEADEADKKAQGTAKHIEELAAAIEKLDQKAAAAKNKIAIDDLESHANANTYGGEMAKAKKEDIKSEQELAKKDKAESEAKTKELAAAKKAAAAAEIKALENKITALKQQLKGEGESPAEIPKIREIGQLERELIGKQAAEKGLDGPQSAEDQEATRLKQSGVDLATGGQITKIQEKAEKDAADAKKKKKEEAKRRRSRHGREPLQPINGLAPNVSPDPDAEFNAAFPHHDAAPVHFGGGSNNSYNPDPAPSGDGGSGGGAAGAHTQAAASMTQAGQAAQQAAQAAAAAAAAILTSMTGINTTLQNLQTQINGIKSDAT